MIRFDGRALVFSLLAGASSLAVTGAPAAQPKAADVSLKEAPAVLLLLPQRGADRTDVAAVGERLRELSTNVVLAKLASDSVHGAIAEAREAVKQNDAVAALWVDEWRGDRTLFVHVRSSGRTLARRLPRGANPVAEREELASVARGTVSALLDGQAPSMDEVLDADGEKSEPARPPVADGEPPPKRAEPAKPEAKAPLSRPSPAPERDEPPPAARGAARSISASARAGYFGASPLVESGTVLQSGASLGLRLWFPYDLYADGSYAVIPADTVELGATRASIARHPGTLAAGKAFAFDALPALWFSAEVSFGVDRVVRETLSTGDDTARTSTAARWVPSAGARAGAAYLVAPRVSLYALFGAELVASSFRYVSESPAGTDERRVEPLLAKLDVGGIFDLSDAARFSD